MGVRYERPDREEIRRERERMTKSMREAEEKGRRWRGTAARRGCPACANEARSAKLRVSACARPKDAGKRDNERKGGRWKKKRTSSRRYSPTSLRSGSVGTVSANARRTRSGHGSAKLRDSRLVEHDNTSRVDLPRINRAPRRDSKAQRNVVHRINDDALVLGDVFRSLADVRFDDVVAVEEGHLAVRLDPDLRWLGGRSRPEEGREERRNASGRGESRVEREKGGEKDENRQENR